MDWHSERLTSFRYMRVDSKTMLDAEEVTSLVDGGSIEYNDLTSTKVSGSLPFIELPDIGNDYIRVYSLHRQGGEVLEILHGTFIAATPSSVVNRSLRRGSLEAHSLLHIVEGAGLIEPLVIPAGMVAVSYAASLVQGLKLAVVAEPSTARLTAARPYDSGTSKLEVVNDLLAFAGFSSAGIDPSGAVVMHRYTDPASRSPSVVLRDDEPGCMFEPPVTHEFDWFDVPNVFIAIMSNPDGTLAARAVNDDPGSLYSVPSRGWEKVVKEEVSDIESQKALNEYAERRLSELSSAVESVEFSHPWLSYETGEAIRLRYTEAGLDFTGVAVKKTVKLTPALVCSTRLRRFVRR